MDVRVKFLGAARSVTGSRFLITMDGFTMLFDCGLFQGSKELRLRNWDEFPIEAAEIDVIVVSHAHIDHTGYLPKLVKDGFTGPIYCTPPTADLMEIMLLDSAKLQQEEAAYARKKGYSKHKNPVALYDEDDARATFAMFKKVGYKTRFKVHDRAEVVYHDAGHLLGSAITEVFIHGDKQTKKIIFSGDIGRYEQAMLNPPTAFQQADVLFIESTYGSKDNPFDDPEDDLTRIVNETFDRNGVLVIPAFAVGRTQSLLFYLRKLMKEDKIPDVPVYIDSPMAISATYLFYKHPAYHKIKMSRDELAQEMETNMLVFVKSPEHSKSLNALKSRAIIISASGMMTGGRILHHMKQRLPNKQDTFLVAGYQAEGTRGRNLLENSPTIRIFGEDVPVKCKVEFISSMSGHADRGELFSWMGNFTEKPKITFCVHGEGKDLDNYARAIRDTLKWNVIVPEYLESVKLFEGI
ncbi:MAG: MBL fold metallo-hydrolase [Candidatus Atribacteria bacterium]|nr:MAG: MBL fold metallo-hydrolase [Candidatus Atribacteria bacterium]